MADLQNMNRLLGRCLQELQKNPPHFLNGQGVMVQVKVIGGDDYELRIDAPDASGRLASAQVGDSAVSIAGKQDGRQVRVTIKSPTTREVAWEIRFAAAK